MPQRLFIAPGKGDLRNQSVVGARRGGELWQENGRKTGFAGREGGGDKGPLPAGPGLETGDDGKKDQMPSGLSPVDRLAGGESFCPALLTLASLLRSLRE